MKIFAILLDQLGSCVWCAQVMIWRPAELLNGRMAMLGFVAGVGCELITGASVWQQLNYAPYAYLAAYLLNVAAAAVNRCVGHKGYLQRVKHMSACSVWHSRLACIVRYTVSSQLRTNGCLECF